MTLTKIMLTLHCWRPVGLDHKTMCVVHEANFQRSRNIFFNVYDCFNVATILKA